jgi:hypothetical protein
VEQDEGRSGRGGGGVALHRKGPERDLIRCLRSIGEGRSHKQPVGAPDRGAQLAIATNGSMWCTTRQPTLEGGHACHRRRTGADEAGRQPQRSRRRRGVVTDWGQSDPDHIASGVMHKRAPHAACCVRRPSAGRTKGGGGERGPLTGHNGEGRGGERQGVGEGQRIHIVMRI